MTNVTVTSEVTVTLPTYQHIWWTPRQFPENLYWLFGIFRDSAANVGQIGNLSYALPAYVVDYHGKFQRTYIADGTCCLLVIFITRTCDFSHWLFRANKSILEGGFYFLAGFASQAIELFMQRRSNSMSSNNQVLALHNIKER
ncbi:MAG: hypothetical protein C0393_05780 [Anaerolinea sp.]|nr:hypothetical protein [Anaerolinea sp.]